jgi:hypothetical protein
MPNQYGHSDLEDTAVHWTALNTVLNTGQIGLEKDTGLFKIGDGTTAWSSLVYASNDTSYLPLAGGTMTGAITGNKAAGAKFVILPLADSTTAFQVQTAAGANILNVDSTNSRVSIGTATTSTVSKLVVGPYVTADTLANVHITAIAANHKPLVVQGYTAQTADLQQWQNSVGNYVARVGAAGDFGVLYITNPVTTGPYIQLQTTYTRFINRDTITNVPLQVQGMAAQTGNLTEWMNSSLAALASVSAGGLGTFAGVTATALVLTAATATGSAGFRMPHGTAPTTPVDGDLWTTTAGMFVRINGVTKTVTLT